MPDALVSFEVVLRTPGSGRIPTVQNLDQFRPDPEKLEFVRRWLHARGVVAHTTGFGLACSAPATVFESLFGAQLRPAEEVAGAAAWQLDGPIRLPAEIAGLVEEVVLSRTPELF
jgi:hypothetical protein